MPSARNFATKPVQRSQRRTVPIACEVDTIKDLRDDLFDKLDDHQISKVAAFYRMMQTQRVCGRAGHRKCSQ